MSYYEKYLLPYKSQLLKFADDIGLECDSEKMLLGEAWSRRALAAVVKDINSSITLHQHSYYANADAHLHSSGTRVDLEIKCRDCGKHTYPTTDISAAKGDFITGKEGWVVIFFNKDYNYLVFDLADYTPGKGTWSHNRTTAQENTDKVSEQKYMFDPEKAIFSGRIKCGA